MSMFLQRFIKRQKEKHDRRMEPVYAFLDSKFAYTKNDKVLFLDCGANLGQGYAWFSKYFHHPNVSFELFEPNPNCFAHLHKLNDVINGKVKLNPFGIGTEDGDVKFFGLDQAEGGALSQGGSIVKSHNSNHYSASDASSIDVKLVDFSKYLQSKASQFNKIIVKMDIEGAEVELLEKMIADNSIRFINVLYVEFHSQYQKPDESTITQAREQRIIDMIQKDTKVKLRIWH